MACVARGKLSFEKGCVECAHRGSVATHAAVPCSHSNTDNNCPLLPF